jgi:hypothetical protein
VSQNSGNKFYFDTLISRRILKYGFIELEKDFRKAVKMCQKRAFLRLFDIH